jgi:ABC-type xylose transport system permease subunit
MRSINKIQVSIGAIGLLFGSLVYLIDRPPDQTYFVYSTIPNISLYSILPSLFGLLGNSLPAFIHVFSFILITAGLLFYGKKGYLIICLWWLLADSAFEVGQKFTIWSSRIIPDWFNGIPLLENTEGYFLQGTFDFMDLAAIALGATMAWFVLLATGKRGVR